MPSYFTNIDTIEKAYILGLVYKNDNYIMALINNKTVIDILSNFCYNIHKSYTINITNIHFINDIQNSINNFPNFSNDLKIAFVRGLYESNYNQGIDINDTIKEIIDIIKKDFIINYNII